MLPKVILGAMRTYGILLCPNYWRLCYHQRCIICGCQLDVLIYIYIYIYVYICAIDDFVCLAYILATDIAIAGIYRELLERY